MRVNVSELILRQRKYFESGKTRSLSARLSALRALKKSIKDNEELICEALRKDLNKPASESYMCELGIVYEEIGYHQKHLRKWVKNKRVRTPLAQFCSKSFISPEPYGVTLIMSPWNYPFQLCISPLVGAISAGNCAVIKPSAYAPEVSSVIAKIVFETFPQEYVAVVEGGREENQALLGQKFDYIFFTGSVSVGKLVMESAAKHLTPVTLELGGKSPAIVDATADLEIAARRIAFGKTLNAGQTCVAPDYLLIEKGIKEKFIACYKKAIEEFFPTGDFGDYPRIINDKHFERLAGLMQGERVAFGGSLRAQDRFIEPTLLDGVSPDSPIMKEEIFGPVLPILEFDSIDECIELIRANPKPLALYLFTKDKRAERAILDNCSFGGGCVNDTIIHLATSYMGFGGVGESGMGSYHGKDSFDTFSHKRSIVKKRYFPDLPMRYRPYTEQKDRLIKRFLK